MLAVPELQRNEVPDHFSIEGRVAAAMHVHELVKNLRAEISSLASPRIAERILHQGFELGILQEPKSKGNSEAMLLLRKDFVWKNSSHSLFENIAFLKPLKFQLGGNVP